MSTKVGVLFRPSYHLTFDVALQRNDIHLPAPMHDFVTNLVTIASRLRVQHADLPRYAASSTTPTSNS